MYNLRRKRADQYSSGDKLDKDVKIILNRMPILENPLSQDSVFVVQNGRTMIKKNYATGCREKNLLSILFISLFFTVMFAINYKDEWNRCGSHVAKRVVLLPKKLRNLNTYIVNTLHAEWNRRFGQSRYGSVFSQNRKKLHRVKRKREVCYNDIRDFINELWFKVKNPGKMVERRTPSFIEQQCVMNNIVPRIADFVQYSFNNSNSNFDVDSLTDYASYDKGARILSTSGAEPYVEYKVQSGILHYIFGIKYFSIDEQLICGISKTLCRYFVTGPSSLLQPWNKAGECWSFKGIRGRVQIELSERIYIMAVSLEHIPEGFATSENIRSAPAQFSIIGVDDLGGYKFTSRNHLGTYRYLLSEPNIQTFFLSKEDSNHPYKIMEFNVESNHGNKNYTCVYRLRVFGRPFTSVQN